MTRAGRKRKNVKRQPDGRPVQSEGIRDVMRHALEARCRVMGWSAAKWAEARDPRLATLHGRLHLSGRLTEREYLGLSAYAVRRHRWLRAIEAPRESPRCSNLETEPARAHETPDDALFHGALPEEWEDYVKRVTRDFMAAEGELLASGRKSIVSEVLGADETVPPDSVPLEMLASIKWVSRRLAKHFGYS